MKLQEQQEWQLKVDSIDAGDLPRYIEVSCLPIHLYLLATFGNVAAMKGAQALRVCWVAAT